MAGREERRGRSRNVDAVEEAEEEAAAAVAAVWAERAETVQ